MITKTLTTAILSGTIILSGVLFHNDNSTIENGMLVYPDQTENETVKVDETDLVNIATEYHKITDLSSGLIKGERVNGNGEGIYYPLIDLVRVNEDMEKLAVGDVISISWELENYLNEDWEIYKVEFVGVTE